MVSTDSSCGGNLAQAEHRNGFSRLSDTSYRKGKFFNPHADIILQSSRAASPTIVIEAVCDLMTDDHADAAVVERTTLAFAEKR